MIYSNSHTYITGLQFAADGSVNAEMRSEMLSDMFLLQFLDRQLWTLGSYMGEHLILLIIFQCC